MVEFCTFGRHVRSGSVMFFFNPVSLNVIALHPSFHTRIGDICPLSSPYPPMLLISRGCKHPKSYRRDRERFYPLVATA